jgi:hypothetical protein
MVNVVICLAAGAALFTASYLPPVNVFQTRQLYYPELHNWRTGSTGLPTYSEPPFYIDKNGNIVFSLRAFQMQEGQKRLIVTEDNKVVEVEVPKFEQYPAWVMWTARLFWLSWVLLLFNLVPAFPLDGGRILQSLLWGRSGDYRSATQVACWSGLVTALAFLLLSFWQNDSLLLFLALFIMFSSYRQLITLDQSMEEGGAFGYDFSKGYGGFGPEEDAPAAKPKRVGPIKRWLQARRTRKVQREASQRAEDEARLDQLLDKISRTGKESLTAEERRFMDRVSARYRNRP